MGLIVEFIVELILEIIVGVPYDDKENVFPPQAKLVCMILVTLIFGGFIVMFLLDFTQEWKNPFVKIFLVVINLIIIYFIFKGWKNTIKAFKDRRCVEDGKNTDDDNMGNR